MLAQGKATVIPNFVSAPSPQRLRALMYMVNLKLGVQFNYSSITFAQGRWYAWFQHEVEEHQLRELLDGEIDARKKKEGGV